MANLSLSIIALNQGQPFVSREFAGRLALLVVEQKYPRDIFVVGGSGRLVEKEGMWFATFDNSLVGPIDKGMLPIIGGKPAPRQLTVVIRQIMGKSSPSRNSHELLQR